MAFLLGIKTRLGCILSSNPGAYQRVISVAIGTVVAACVENIVKSITSGDDKIELMPMTRPGMFCRTLCDMVCSRRIG